MLLEHRPEGGCKQRFFHGNVKHQVVRILCIDIVFGIGIHNADCAGRFALDNSTSSTGLTMLYNNLGFGGMIAVATGVMVAIGLVTLIFLRNTPEECGLTVDGIESEETHAETENATEVSKAPSRWTLKRFLTTKESWYLGITIGVFSSFGVQLMSILKDNTGSLSMGYAIFAVLCAIGTICMFLIQRTYAEISA